jgi:catechol 2,3-dioxygenase-like lactoylglutathione lyase family enzyme
MGVAEHQKPAAGGLVLDHLAHFVPDLDAAAAVWESLGFRVSERSEHQVEGKSAGTANRCVLFERGYVEILTPTLPALPTPNAQRVRERMAKFVGVHLAAFGTPDAEAERRRLVAQGFAPDPLVHLGRTLADGKPLRCSVVHVPPPEMPEGRVQYCEQLTPENLWQPRYVNPLSLEGVFVVADDPQGAAARWGRFSGLLPRRDGGLVHLEMARGRVTIGTRSALQELLGAAPAAPALAGYALGCRDPHALAERCRAAGMAVQRKETAYAVLLPAALGGAWLFG